MIPNAAIKSTCYALSVRSLYSIIDTYISQNRLETGTRTVQQLYTWLWSPPLNDDDATDRQTDRQTNRSTSPDPLWISYSTSGLISLH